MLGGAVHPPIFTGDALGQPPTFGGRSRTGQGGGPDGQNPRQDTPWAEFGQGGADHHEPAMGRTTDHLGGGPRGLEGGHGHLGPAKSQDNKGGPQGAYWRGTGWPHYNNGMNRWGQHGVWERGEPPRRGNFSPSYGGEGPGPPGETFHHESWGEGRQTGGKEMERIKTDIQHKEGGFKGAHLENSLLLDKEKMVLPYTSSHIPILLQEYHHSAT